jgi:hypothetical protein
MKGGQQHFLPVAAETGSVLKIREWVEDWDAHQGYLFLGSFSGEVGVDPAKHLRDHPTNYQHVGGIWVNEINAERDDHRGFECWH